MTSAAAAATPMHPQDVQPDADADELGHQGQRVQDEQIDDAEGPPKLAESLQDEPGVPDPGNGAQAQDHLLVDIQHGHEQRQGPEKRSAVILAGLGIGAEGPGVVIAHHDDEARAENGQERTQPVGPSGAGRQIFAPQRAERAADLAVGFWSCLHHGRSPLVSSDGAIRRNRRPRRPLDRRVIKRAWVNEN
jgi:hypothetical protein